MTLTPALATAVMGSLAFVGVLVGVRFRWLSDQRDAWWKRAQWAINKSLEKDSGKRIIGAEAMTVLGTDKHASRADLHVLDVALLRSMDFVYGESHDGS